LVILQLTFGMLLGRAIFQVLLFKLYAKAVFQCANASSIMHVFQMFMAEVKEQLSTQSLRRFYSKFILFFLRSSSELSHYLDPALHLLYESVFKMHKLRQLCIDFEVTCLPLKNSTTRKARYCPFHSFHILKIKLCASPFSELFRLFLWW
jgi:hypothetical protein